MQEDDASEISVRELLKTHYEEGPTYCTATTASNGEAFLRFEGAYFPSYPNVMFGVRLKAGTTLRQAEALAAHITEYAPTLFFRWTDFELEGLERFERDENGFAILDRET